MHSAPNLARSHQRQAVHLAALLVFALLFVIGAVRAAQVPDLQNPTSFFTNVASRLLQAQLGVDLNRIQVFPTNQYTPAVHRLLQLTANIYDAATNRDTGTYPFLPTVFRPLFTNESGAIYISGYVEEPGLGVLSVPMRDVSDPNDRAVLQSTDMIYGVPIVIGAKKGFPNFNEFALLNDTIVSRRLDFHRNIPGGPIARTNQTYNVAISNAFGVELWNSYTNPFPRSIDLTVVADITCSVTNMAGIVNGPDGSPLSNSFQIVISTNITNWAGFRLGQKVSFIAPINTNYLFLTNCQYSFTQNQFLPIGALPSDPPNNFPIPQWSLNLRGRLRVVMVDHNSQRIIDYVNLDSSEPSLNLPDQLHYNPNGVLANCNTFDDIGSLFCTNRFSNSADPAVATFGVQNQILVSVGAVAVSDAYWADYAAAQNKAAEIAIFRQNLNQGGAMDFAAPFSPRQVVHQNLSWQANDPLIHYIVPDLIDLLGIRKPVTYGIDDSSSPFQDFAGRPGTVDPLNAHYRPWGGKPGTSGDTSPPTKIDPAVKDPLVGRSDDWTFPTNGYPALDWLGHVHRGTPWQTLNLKSAVADPAAWQKWSGVTNAGQAALTHPTNDWRTASLLLSLLNTNDPRSLHSINPPDASGWQADLDGLTAETNNGTPILVLSNSLQAGVIAGALTSARQSLPQGFFRDVGDILAVPELTLASPYLSPSLLITDEMYEKIPSQLLPLLRPDSIGTITPLSNGVNIQFTGFDGYQYLVEVASNLIQWTPLATMSPTNGTFTFVGSSRVDLQACKLEYSIVSPK